MGFEEEPKTSSTSTLKSEETSLGQGVGATALSADIEQGIREVNNVIDWDGVDDPANPKNWAKSRKWAALFVVSSFTFISPVSSSMVAPALDEIGNSLHTSDTVVKQLFLSIFILAYAVGPFMLGPLSEMYGRVPVLQTANLFYLVFNIACGFCHTKNQMLAFRFLSGLGGSAPLAIGGGVIGDCFEAHERGAAVSVYSLAPLLGPAIGPIAGGFIVESTSWRWIFWATSIADLLIQLSGLFLLQETHGPTLLSRKCKRLRKVTNNTSLRTVTDVPGEASIVKLRQAMVRPFRLLITQPIVQFLALYMAYIYGLMYLVLSTFPTLWTRVYKESTNIGSLNYIAIGLGFFLGSQIAPRINDRIYRNLQSRNQGVGRPEFRIIPVLFGSVAVPAGLLLYGWSSEKALKWPVPDVGIFIFSLGVIVCFQCAQTYLIDTYTRYAASALAAVNVLRSLAGFGFPLFGPAMFAKLGYGWGGSLLAFVAIGIGSPASWILWRYGQALRAKSGYAVG